MVIRLFNASAKQNILASIEKELDEGIKDVKPFAKHLSDIIKKYNIQKDNNPDRLGWEIAKNIMSSKNFTKSDILKLILEDVINRKPENEEDMVPNEVHQKIIDDESLSKNQKIKDLILAGASIGMISSSLKLSYQRVRNIAKKIQVS